MCVCVVLGPDSPLPKFSLQNMFRTKATLVLCPSHLAKQWETEVGKHTNPALKARLRCSNLSSSPWGGPFFARSVSRPNE